MNKAISKTVERVLQRIEEETKYRFMPIVGRKKGKLRRHISLSTSRLVMLRVSVVIGGPSLCFTE